MFQLAKDSPRRESRRHSSSLPRDLVQGSTGSIDLQNPIAPSARFRVRADNLDPTSTAVTAMKEHPERPIFGPEDARLDPPNPPEIRPARSIAKAVSWRVVGTIDTLVLSFVILTYLGPLFGLEEVSAADRARTAIYIALTEVGTKLTLYYLHERFWSRLHWDRIVDEEGHHRDGTRRSVTKTATWRVLASLDTMVLGLVFTGNLATAISIGGFEVITKLVLYFFHERGWARIRWGIIPASA